MNRRTPLLAAVRAADVDAVRLLLDEGCNPRRGNGRTLPLHVAARNGPLELVELLIARGALVWQTDARGRTALHAARRGTSVERDAIVALLDRDAIADPVFRAAVAAIHAGDVRELKRLLDAEPRLLRERNAGPAAYRRATRPDYFRDPKLVWYVANNPETTARMASNVVEIAGVMIARGVDRDDLDTTLGLVASSSSAREQGHQRPLIRALLDAGARATHETILVTAGHAELDALQTLLDCGTAMNAPIAAALGDTAALARLLADASGVDVLAAFGLAVINRQVDAARLALDAHADIDAFLPVHAHSTALHHAAGANDVPMVRLLLARGARTDRRDTLWDGTPLDWASFAGNDEARMILADQPH